MRARVIPARGVGGHQCISQSMCACGHPKSGRGSKGQGIVANLRRCTAGALLAGCPAARRRRSCCLVARAMCRPWPLAIRRVLSSSRHPRSPHVITGSDARGEAAGPARRNLEESSKQSAMLPATASSFEAHDLRYEMLSFMLHIIHAQN